jgi:hypothetical protein
VNKYRVTSRRMSWPAGTLLDEQELEGCNIPMLLATGHLTAAPEAPAKATDEPAAKPKE